MQKLFKAIALLLPLISSLLPLQASDDVIRERPSGETTIFWRSGGAYEYFYDTPSLVQQTGLALEMITAPATDAGQTREVFIKDILSTGREGTYVRGTLSADGTTLTVPSGQVIEFWEERGYGIYLSLVDLTVEGFSTYYTLIKGDIEYRLNDGVWELQGTADPTTGNKSRVVGAIYTDDNSYSGYCEWQTQLHPVEQALVTPPADLVTTTYSMRYGKGGETSLRTINVGFADDKVYMQGLSEALPDSWMEGTIDGNDVSIAMQFAGIANDYVAYYLPTKRTDTWNADYQMTFYNYTSVDAVHLTLEADRQVITTAPLANSKQAQAILITRGPKWINNASTILFADEPTFTAFTENPATPAAPIFVEYDDSRFAERQYTKVCFDIPTTDSEGGFINPDKLSYCFYLDDDIPYIFYADDYLFFSEDLDEIPYNYSDGLDFKTPGHTYVYMTGFERIGCQTIYRGGGEEHRSPIVYYNVDKRQVEGEDVDGMYSVLAPTSSSYSFDVLGRVYPAHQSEGFTKGHGIVISNGRKTIK